MDENTKQQPASGQSQDNRPVKLEFSLPQLLGSALAAATAAYLGSSLGTAGTIIGAALASVVGAVAATIYTAGLDRTGRRLSTVMKRGWQRVQGEDPSADLAPGEGNDLVVEHHDPGTMAPVPDGPVESPEQRRRTWLAVRRRVLVAALAIFAVTLVAITVIELVLGRSLDGGSGTTVGQVVRPDPAPSSEPSPSESPSPTASPTPTPTPAPTPTVTEPSPSVEPTPTEPSEPTTPVDPTEPAPTLSSETAPATED